MRKLNRKFLLNLSLVFLMASNFCHLAYAARKSELSQFMNSVLNNPHGRTSYENCLRALVGARFEGEAHRFNRPNKKLNAFTVRSWFGRVVNRNSPRKIWVRVTAYGFLDESKPPGEGRYFINYVDTVNFGFVPETFDFQGALRETENAKRDPKSWRSHVEKTKIELEETLKSLRLGAAVVVMSNSLGTLPLEQLAIGFANEEHKQRWRSAFANFRGVPILPLLKGRGPKPKPAPVAYSHDPEDFQWVEESPTANLHKLTGTIRTAIARLLEIPGSRPGWSARFTISVKVTSDEAADELGLTRKGFARNSYQTNCSLEKIAELSVDPRIVLISTRNQ